MTLPVKQDLDRILKFCAASPKTAPSPPLRRGEVYCLSGFARRAEQWYREEAGRQLAQRSRGAQAAASRRRQPSRAAKGRTSEPGDYVLFEDELNSLLASAAGRPTPDKERDLETAARLLLTPPGDESEDTDGDDPRKSKSAPDRPAQGPEAKLSEFRTRLGRAVHARAQELRARHDREGGVRHMCTVGSGGWDCVDEEYCGHGLVDRCVRWVPRGKAHLRARVRFEMEAFFSSGGSVDNNGDGGDNKNNNNNTPERLAELKKARAAALKAETMRRMEGVEARLQSATSAAAEAEMLESPTLGRWPAGSQGFLREDVGAQRVELAGLEFAVDVCLGEPRVLML